MKRLLTAIILILAVLALIFFGQLCMITLAAAIVAVLATPRTHPQLKPALVENQLNVSSFHAQREPAVAYLQSAQAAAPARNR